MASNNVHWGEFEDKRHEDWSLSLSDLEELILPPSPPPPLYQPSQEETASFQILPPEMCRSDPVVLHTIRLLQHQRQLLQLLTRPQTFGLDLNASLPPFPEDPPVKRKAAKFHYLNFLPPNDTAFTMGVSKSQKLEMEASTARLILRKAVATMCAHAGYTDTTEAVLRVTTDAAHDFLTKITRVLRANKDSMLLTGNCPFHDVVEQTLHDMRMGGMAELHRMYRDRVLTYHARVRQRTVQLHHQYQSLLNQAGSTVLNQSSSSNLRRESSSSVEPQAGAGDESGGAATVSLPGVALYAGPSAPGVEETSSLLSIKSNSSVDPDASVQPFSVHSQAEEEQASPATVQSLLFSASR